MNHSPLNQAIILNTRPKHQHASLTYALQAKGATVYSLPCIAIQNIPTQAIQTQLNECPSPDIAVFTSANAAKAIASTWPPSFKPYIIAIGPGTKQALESISIIVDAIPKTYNTQGLLDLIHPLSHSKKIMVITGKQSSEHLINELTYYKKQVSTIISYERTLPEPTAFSLADHAINLIISTSLASLKNLTQLLQQQADTLKAIPLVVVNNDMKQYAIDDGWAAPITISPSADDETITLTIEKITNPLR